MAFKVQVYKNRSFRDKRGYYWTSWKKNLIKNLEFKHDKFSSSKKNVLRGLHGDKKTWKLISCPYGKLFLVVVNCVKNSKDYLKWKSYTLSHKNGKQVLVPPNYANGHYCLSNECLFHYKLAYKGKYADVEQQFSLRWDDTRLNIRWPLIKRKCRRKSKQKLNYTYLKPILSVRDRKS
jgi:dTDP-4-dehydrorhamnose 3,5-epimerase|tara:strand:- start:411 stop:944 length:534 start_codon:yes stop_codon:yes gene_type:complete